jgi:hypothetical protein
MRVRIQVVVEPEFRGLSFLQIPPRGGHPCLALRFRSSRPAEDLHLLPSQHVWHTTRPPRLGAGAVQIDTALLEHYYLVLENSLVPAVSVVNT